MDKNATRTWSTACLATAIINHLLFLNRQGSVRVCQAHQVARSIRCPKVLHIQGYRLLWCVDNLSVKTLLLPESIAHDAGDDNKNKDNYGDNNRDHRVFRLSFFFDKGYDLFIPLIVEGLRVSLRLWQLNALKDIKLGWYVICIGKHRVCRHCPNTTPRPVDDGAELTYTRRFAVLSVKPS